MLGDIVLVSGALVLGVLLLHPRVQNAANWRATVTPLASIIGSGFLVAAPILSHLAGRWAVVAMVGLCVVGYYYGAIIRHNIRVVEPVLDDHPPLSVRTVETMSSLALSLAYFISVAYYLNLFAAFALRGGGITEALVIKSLSTTVILSLGLLGSFRGLLALERLETFSVGIKLAVIGGLCAALLLVSMRDVAIGDFAWPALDHTTGIAEVQVWLGLIILVQGFETSRYLGESYDRPTRVRTMRHAQWIASIIYFAFILLATRYFGADVPEQGGETAIIDMLRPLGMLVAPLLIVAALASQLSAAVADLGGAGGLLSESTGKRIPVKFGYLFTAAAAIGATWAADIFEIITYASKAFVLYYGLQSLQAALTTARGQRKAKWLWTGVYGAGVLLAVVIIVFAVPASV